MKDRIEHVHIQNFKCFEDVDLYLKQFNILTGPNSAGKSTVIQAILSNLQSLDKDGNALNGRFVQLGKVADVKNYYTRGEIKITTNHITESRNQWITYLTTERVGSGEDFKQNPEDELITGLHGEYAFDYLSRTRMDNILEKEFAYDIEAGINFGNQVDYWLEYLCGYTITAERIEGTSIVKVLYHPKGEAVSFRANHVGTGVTYLAEIVIAALSCAKNDLFIIENPELYLHPAAQSKITELFSFLASRGLQIIVETHSDHIINGARKSVRRKEISPNDLSIFYINKNRDVSEVSIIDVSEDGAIMNPMKGFFDQIDDDLDVLLGFADEHILH